MTAGQLNLADMKSAHTQQQSTQTAPRKRDKDKTIFDFLNGDANFQKAIGAVAGKFFTPDRFLRLAINAVKKTPLLAYCDTQSVLGAFMASAALGLEPNTVLQQAFLIPYKKRVKQANNEWTDAYECQFQIGARGFITLAYRSPLVKSIQSEAIHDNDHWKHMLGTKSFLEYEKKLKDRGALAGAFCYTLLESGAETATVLPLDDIYKIRSKSETFNALTRAVEDAESERDKIKARKKLDETPWVIWEDDMAAKSAIKKHAKQLPIAAGDAFAVAVQLDGDDGQSLDIATMTDPDLVREVMENGVDAAAAGKESVSFPAVEDAPSPTLNAMQGGTAGDAAPLAQNAEQAQQKGQSTSATGAPEDAFFNGLKNRLETLADPDLLDAEADLISEVEDADKQAELTSIYKTRRDELANPPQTTRQSTARRSSMKID